MKHWYLTLLMILGLFTSRGQDTVPRLEGSVSFITSQNVYVKFKSTLGISTGDTLYALREGKEKPLLKVTSFSSISCVCTPLNDAQFRTGELIIFHQKNQKKLQPSEIIPVPVIPPVQNRITPSGDTIRDVDTIRSRQYTRGFISLSSYLNWSGDGGNSNREKLTFSFNGRNLGNSVFSTEIYLSTVINSAVTYETPGVADYLKVYNLSVSADLKKFSVLLGRKINPRLSSMGANDGLQAEYRLLPFSAGVIAGFRPDFSNYGFNADLFQFGGYIGHESAGKHGMMQSTLAFINQTNSSKTDRRYLYLQHVNSLVKNVTFFGSADIDLYKMKFSNSDSTFHPSGTFDLTNLYISLGYRLKNKLYLNVSYNERQNIVYYETYRNYLDKMLNFETFRGLLFHAGYNPLSRLSFGFSAGYRMRENDPRPGSNFYGNVAYVIPGAEISATGSVAILSTGYLNGNVYSAGVSRNLYKGKIYMGLIYRYTDYSYTNTELDPLLQNIGEINLTWRLLPKLVFSTYYEGTFERSTSYNRLFLQLNWGF